MLATASLDETPVSFQLRDEVGACEPAGAYGAGVDPQVPLPPVVYGVGADAGPHTAGAGPDADDGVEAGVPAPVGAPAAGAGAGPVRGLLTPHGAGVGVGVPPPGAPPPIP